MSILYQVIGFDSSVSWMDEADQEYSVADRIEILVRDLIRAGGGDSYSLKQKRIAALDRALALMSAASVIYLDDSMSPKMIEKVAESPARYGVSAVRTTSTPLFIKRRIVEEPKARYSEFFSIRSKSLPVLSVTQSGVMFQRPTYRPRYHTSDSLSIEIDLRHGVTRKRMSYDAPGPVVTPIFQL